MKYQMPYADILHIVFNSSYKFFAVFRRSTCKVEVLQFITGSLRDSQQLFLCCIKPYKTRSKSYFNRKSTMDPYLTKFFVGLKVLSGSSEAALQCAIWLMLLANMIASPSTPCIKDPPNTWDFFSANRSEKVLTDLIFPELLSNKL